MCLVLIKLISYSTGIVSLYIKITDNRKIFQCTEGEETRLKKNVFKSSVRLRVISVLNIFLNV